MTTPLPSDLAAPPAWDARAVRELRKILGLTQTQFGALLGLSLRSVRRLESKPELDRLERWAIEGVSRRISGEIRMALPLLRARPLARASPFQPRDG